ncbi:hypothetical protein K1T71_002203 [Dendrolimus kikuchii]|uniref:Uncharacterized protein n=1 Tax=Dendrolimus kikuchii TaxID=765133 RepID=A0ACC1DFU3_9NEOP|nr:hypothetical protein K1T71_002203 [Dendrolimus kikuchii]
MLELKTYVRVVAAVFSVSSATALVMALLRLLNPELYYLDPLESKDKSTLIHYFISGLMIVTSAIGFLNSCVVINRSSLQNVGRNITAWLLFDSLFETSRVVYVFVCKIVLNGKGTLQLYELVISVVQYLLDSFLYCQMILRH